jgi:cytochrome c oxidase subunit II
MSAVLTPIFASFALVQAADGSLSPTNIFAPVSASARSIFELSVFVLVVAAAIFLVVFGLLAYCVVKFRKRANDNGREPAQVYGSNQVELAWTVIPILIVVTLLLATARVIADIQNADRPGSPIEVIAIGHQFWWEYRFPALSVVGA